VALTVGEMMTLVPVRAVAFETLEDGRVVLLRPKFLSPAMGWIQRLLPRPVFRVKLDAKGAFIWGVLDGHRTAAMVCEAVREHFGSDAEPVEERTLAFLHQMASGGFIRLETPGTP